MFQPGLSAAAAIARTPTPAVVSGPANSAATNGAATKVPTIAADSRVSVDVGDHADGERQQAGDEPEQVVPVQPPPGRPPRNLPELIADLRPRESSRRTSDLRRLNSLRSPP